MTLPLPPGKDRKLPLPPVKSSSLPLPSPPYKRTPAITLEALQQRANERGVHLYLAAYSVIDPKPWHFGYLVWLGLRTKEAERLGRTTDFTSYILDYINSHPSKETAL